jgi:hypothetical protein
LGTTHGETPFGGAWSTAAFKVRLEPLHSAVAEVLHFRHVEVANTSVRNEMRKIAYAGSSAPNRNLDGKIAALRPQHCQQRAATTATLARSSRR